jgi:hypothetical protein
MPAYAVVPRFCSIVITENDIHFIFTGQSKAYCLGSVVEVGHFGCKPLSTLKYNRRCERSKCRMLPVCTGIYNFTISSSTRNLDHELLAGRNNQHTCHYQRDSNKRNLKWLHILWPKETISKYI